MGEVGRGKANNLRDMERCVMSFGANDCAIAGCDKVIVVLGTILRASLRALQLSGEVYKARVTDAVELAKLGRSFRQDNLTMASLTGSFCEHFYEIADEQDLSSQQSGCADMLVRTGSRIIAYDTTYEAFLETLALVPTPRSVAVVIGAGPAALSAVCACRELGFHIVGVTSQSWISTETLHESEDAEKLRHLAALPTLWPTNSNDVETTKFSREMRLQFSEFARLAQVVIQTAPLDPSSDDIHRVSRIISWPQTRKDTLVCDLAFGSRPSPFVAEAQRHGRSAISGIDMLTTRGLRMMEIWTGLRPPLAPIRAAAIRTCEKGLRETT